MTLLNCQAPGRMFHVAVYACTTLNYYIIENSLHSYNLNWRWHLNGDNVTRMNFQHWYLTRWPGLIFNAEMWPSGQALTGLSMASKFKVNTQVPTVKISTVWQRVSGSFICWVQLLNRPVSKVGVEFWWSIKIHNSEFWIPIPKQYKICFYLIYSLFWTMSWENKSDWGCGKVRLKPAYSATETS